MVRNFGNFLNEPTRISDCTLKTCQAEIDGGSHTCAAKGSESIIMALVRTGTIGPIVLLSVPRRL